MTSKSKHRSSVDEGTVDKASRFLLKVLRHSPQEYGISLNSRGWASVKDVRQVLNSEFDSHARVLLQEILDADDENRFQIISEGTIAFIRATRKHTANEVQLLDVFPETGNLSWYRVSYPTLRADEYVEATSKDALKRLIEERIVRDVLDWSEVNIEKLEKDITWRGEMEIPEDVRRHTVSDDLSGDSGPQRMIHQSGDKPLVVERRVNQAGSKGRYVKPQPERVRSRLP